MLKSFDEFLETVSDDDWDGICKKSVEGANSSEKTNLPTKLLDASLLQNVMIMRLYHEWLSKQL